MRAVSSSVYVSSVHNFACEWLPGIRFSSGRNVTNVPKRAFACMQDNAAKYDPSPRCPHDPPLMSEDVPVQVFIAEFPLRIVLFTQLNKLRHLLVDTLQFRGRGRKQLSPVRPRMERG